LHRKPPEPVVVDETPVEGSIKELFPITLRQVRRATLEKLFNGLIAQYHYVGYKQPVGEHLKCLALSKHRIYFSDRLSKALSRFEGHQAMEGTPRQFRPLPFRRALLRPKIQKPPRRYSNPPGDSISATFGDLFS